MSIFIIREKIKVKIKIKFKFKFKSDKFKIYLILKRFFNISDRI